VTATAPSRLDPEKNVTVPVGKVPKLCVTTFAWMVSVAPEGMEGDIVATMTVVGAWVTVTLSAAAALG
jgi:hypothetical protein